jgi:hypothetical protein
MEVLDVINGALPKVGQNRVTTPLQSKASRALYNQYPASLSAVLSAHPWDCFKKFITLEAEVDGSDEIVSPADTHFGYQFEIPVDFCRLIEESPTGYQYDRVARRFYYSGSTFSFWYVAFPYYGDWDSVSGIDAVRNWAELPVTSDIFSDIYFDHDILEAVQYHMIKEQAYLITGDHNDTQIFEGKYDKTLASQKTVVAQQKPDMFVEATEWLEARG